MWSILLLTNSDRQDLLAAEMWERGTSGILEEPGYAFRVFFESEEAARQVERDFPGIAIGLREEPPQAPSAASFDCEPVFASGFVVVPEDTPIGLNFEGRIPLAVNAAMAFGSGRHETTQLCLQALQTHLQKGDTVIDVGCGSGILSLAAQKLGAGRVFACDIHADAIRIASNNFAGPVFRGSADAIADASGDIVLANISARINDRIAADLLRILKPRGILILSGFVAENLPQCFHPQMVLSQGDWLCWICGVDGVKPDEPPPDVNTHPEAWWL